MVTSLIDIHTNTVWRYIYNRVESFFSIQWYIYIGLMMPWWSRHIWMFEMDAIYIYICAGEWGHSGGDARRSQECSLWCCGEPPGFCVGCGLSWVWSYKKGCFRQCQWLLCSSCSLLRHDCEEAQNQTLINKPWSIDRSCFKKCTHAPTYGGCIYIYINQV